MFRRYKRRHTNILFVIFRLFLSLIIFAALLGGIFSAYKHFSGVDALNLSPKSIANIVLGFVSQQKLIQSLPKQISERILGQSKNSSLHPKGVNGTLEKERKNGKQSEGKSPQFMFRFALLADSHSDNTYLKKALDQIKKDYKDLSFIIGLGDYSDVGTLDELRKAKNELDNSGFRYFVTPGDHDLWDSRNKQSLPSNDGKSIPPTSNFEAVFGPTFQSFIHENFLLLILNNSDNYFGLGDAQKKWVSSELDKSKEVLGILVFLHEPLFHPSSDHFMGRTTKSLRIEASDLIVKLADRGIKKIFAGDTHFFSEYVEPKTNLSMVTVGAITSVRNLQNPRFAIVSVFEDGNIEIEDIEVR